MGHLLAICLPIISLLSSVCSSTPSLALCALLPLFLPAALFVDQNSG